MSSPFNHNGGGFQRDLDDHSPFQVDEQDDDQDRAYLAAPHTNNDNGGGSQRNPGNYSPFQVDDLGRAYVAAPYNSNSGGSPFLVDEHGRAHVAALHHNGGNSQRHQDSDFPFQINENGRTYVAAPWGSAQERLAQMHGNGVGWRPSARYDQPSQPLYYDNSGVTMSQYGRAEMPVYRGPAMDVDEDMDLDFASELDPPFRGPAPSENDQMDAPGWGEMPDFESVNDEPVAHPEIGLPQIARPPTGRPLFAPSPIASRSVARPSPAQNSRAVWPQGDNELSPLRNAAGFRTVSQLSLKPRKKQPKKQQPKQKLEQRAEPALRQYAPILPSSRPIAPQPAPRQTLTALPSNNRAAVPTGTGIKVTPAPRKQRSQSLNQNKSAKKVQVKSKPFEGQPNRSTRPEKENEGLGDLNDRNPTPSQQSNADTPSEAQPTAPKKTRRPSQKKDNSAKERHRATTKETMTKKKVTVSRPRKTLTETAKNKLASLHMVFMPEGYGPNGEGLFSCAVEGCEQTMKNRRNALLHLLSVSY